MSHRRSALAVSAILALIATGRSAAGAAFVDDFVPFTSTMQVQGPAAESTVVHFQVALRLADPAGLDRVIAAHRVLTPAQIDAYLPGPAAIGAVVDWLHGQGLTVEATPALAVRASGTAAQVARALGVRFVNVDFEGRDYVSADRAPAIPAALGAYLLGITGLEPQFHASPMLSRARDVPAASLNATGGKPPFYPSDLLTAYDGLGLGSGAGSITAIVTDVFPNPADLTAFWNLTGVNQILGNISFIQTIPGAMTASTEFTSVNVEQASAMAPAGKVRIYASNDLGFSNLDYSFQAIIADLRAGIRITQVTASFGACENYVGRPTRQQEDQYFATMTAMGASVFTAAGDAGAFACGSGYQIEGFTPSFPATIPHATSVGATTLTLNPDRSIASETGWSAFKGGGSSSTGGGVSKYYATPNFQQSLGYAMRATPDLMSAGDPNTGVLVVYGGGKMAQLGGTGVSTPAWAGFIGLINAQRLSHGRPPLGLVASLTTKLVDTGNLHDITVGNNGYPAAIGYDLVTGEGSPNLRTLAGTLSGFTP